MWMAGFAVAGDIVFATPSDDRWHYPFNFNPGRRPVASCFGSTADADYMTFNDRDGIFLIAWQTDELFCGGLPPGAYDIRALRVTLTGAVCSACPTPDWIVDLTTEGMNLEEALTRLRRETERAPIPLLAFTTHAAWKQTAQLHHLCNQVVTKDELSRDLPALLAKYLGAETQ
jgi:CheY-like chemotaxis protein